MKHVNKIMNEIAERQDKTGLFRLSAKDAKEFSDEYHERMRSDVKRKAFLNNV